MHTGLPLYEQGCPVQTGISLFPRTKPLHSPALAAFIQQAYNTQSCEASIALTVANR